jgi:hypothetical protein
MHLVRQKRGEMLQGPYEVGNQHGFLCPTCGEGDSLYITAAVSAALTPDGCDTTTSDTEWEKSSEAWCGCGWMGKVSDFKRAENFDEWAEEPGEQEDDDAAK